MESNKNLDLGIFILRIFLGGLLLINGLNLIFNVLNGPAMSQLVNIFQSSGFPYSRIFAWFYTISFIVLGALIILGLFVRAAAAYGIILLVFYIGAIQWKMGFSAYRGGIDYSLLVLGNFIAVFLFGRGRHSLIGKK